MLQFLAKTISIVFHPLWMATYLLLILLMVNPYEFGFNNIEQGTFLIIIVFIFSFVLPGFAIFLMKQLGFVRSLALEDKKERIAPLVTTAVFYLWLMANTLGTGMFPPMYSMFLLGAIITLFVCLFFNSFFKVSLHAAGIAGILAMVVLLVVKEHISIIDFELFGFHFLLSAHKFIYIFIFLSGLIGTVRLYLAAHKPFEVYRGYMIGLMSVMTGYFIYPIFF